jgi:hypothetical protein
MTIDFVSILSVALKYRTSTSAYVEMYWFLSKELYFANYIFQYVFYVYGTLKANDHKRPEFI